MSADNLGKYLNLREKFPEMIFEEYHLTINHAKLHFGYDFHIPGLGHFYPEYTVSIKAFYAKAGLNHELIDSIVFHIGLIEMISYWKLVCPPRIKIKAGILSDNQVSWWRSLYHNGLGEFFYTNGINVSQDEFIEEFLTEGKSFVNSKQKVGSSILVPVGGGKDSVVSMELLKKQDRPLVPFVLNPREASLRSIEKAGFKKNNLLTIDRKLDPYLLELNKKGFLNGHTPFSALLAFLSVLGASLTGSGEIALSNESSANEPTIPGTTINHQYSKSFHFESAFRDYLEKYITQDIEYYSLLRPINELQIAKLFADLPHHYFSFRSCNAGSKTDSWCCKCSKCLFTYIILSPFIDPKVLKKIFGHELLNDSSLKKILDDLTGISEEKPFECVGTIDEVRAALHEVTSQYEKEGTLPALLQHYNERGVPKNSYFHKILFQWSEDNFVPEAFVKLLKDSIDA